MPFAGWLTLAVTVGALVAMASGRISADRALLAALILLVITGIVEPERALAGLSNPGVATVALLFVIAAGVRRSGLLGTVVRHLLGAPAGALGAQLRLMFPVAVLSGFLNNTPIVAMLVPEVRRWGSDRNIAPSYLLIPLSYATILGGMCTLIGTSTNLLIDGLLVDRGYEHLDVFWITPLGVPAALAGLAVIALLGRRLLPERRAADLPLADPRRFSAEVLVEARGPLVGKRLGDIVVPGLGAFAPFELQRGGMLVGAPRSDEVLEAGDILVFTAAAGEVLEIQRVAGLAPIRDPDRGLAGESDFGGRGPKKGPTGTLAEVVVGPTCPLVGHLVGDGSFRREFGAAVVAVAREGERTQPSSLATWTLEPGDTLLVEANGEFIERHRYGSHLVLVSDHGRPTPHARWHAPYCLLLVLGMAILAATGVTSMLLAAVLASVAMLLAGVATTDELAADIEWRVLIAIVAALGLGGALTDTGAAANIAHGIVGLGSDSTWVTLALIYLATAITTEFVTNNAAAVLMLPIALDTAKQAGVSELPFIAVVMIAASASFITPIGYQTNLMVFGPGGYRFGDFLRMGTPVSLAVAITAILLTPWLWPF
jgi:di/tricarboxylate transporter